jgi:SAM-dependent methyltransferase
MPAAPVCALGRRTRSGSAVTAAELAQGDLNAATWTRRNFLRVYSTQTLRPVERVIIRRHQNALAGRVLELGCGGGRLAGHLIEIAQSLYGIDISPRMVEHCRRRYPQGNFGVADLRNLISFDDGSFDAIFATCNVLDVLDDFERRGVLDQIHRVLAPGGLLVMSSHNREYASTRSAPKPTSLNGSSLPSRVKSALYMPRRVRNHHKLAPLERDERDYAVLNDESHGFSLLHYYVSALMQAKQLAEHDFALIECLDLDGRSVRPGDRAEDCHELHYVARRVDRAGTPRARITDTGRGRRYTAASRDPVYAGPPRLHAR